MVTIYVDEDGFFIVDCPALPGCMSQGKTRDEALANIREAIELNIESRRELDLPIYSDTAEIEIIA